MGEHVASADEATVIRNLHAHNCRGIILSWAVLGQKGPGHINNHDNAYLMRVFTQLGCAASSSN